MVAAGRSAAPLHALLCAATLSPRLCRLRWVCAPGPRPNQTCERLFSLWFAWFRWLKHTRVFCCLFFFLIFYCVFFFFAVDFSGKLLQ